MSGVLQSVYSDSLNQTIHRFYGDGYRAVADDMPNDRVSECAIPSKFLNKRKWWRTFYQSPQNIETLRENAYFWKRRSFETAWSLEKHFYENEYDAFMNTLNWIQSDFNTIQSDYHSFNHFRVYAESVIMVLIRLQEEKMPQRSWLSAQRLDRLLNTRRSYYSQTSSVARYATVMTMVIISYWLSEYEKENGMLPFSLEEANIPESLRTDIWKRPISYTQTDGRWFLLSLGERGASDKYVGGDIDINNNNPFFQYSFNSNIVLYSGISIVLSDYYRTGKLKVGRFSFVRNPETGAPGSGSSLPARIAEE